MTAVPVVAAVVRREEKLLLCQRPAHKRHGGLWEFPGGKVDHGESREEAVRRELEEELGVATLSVGRCLLSEGDPGSAFVIEFWETQIEGEPEAREHAALTWATPEEAATLPLAPSDRAFVEMLRKG